MKTTLIVSMAAGLAAAQSVGNVPECARDCVGKVIGSVAGCKSSDIGCFCKDKAFINNIVCCIAKTNDCNAAQLNETLKYADSLSTHPYPSPSSNSTSGSTGSSSSSTAGAAGAGSVGGFAGAVLAMLAAL
ncbi:hypothetical protein ACCO45_000792 [Purpureocillium lilacinum]|uniref:Uncharacterized protein n=1 Tax=Purpureocillium lilacinum TaxID=33203 RepID=A0ACC4E8E6_PURLI